jgi:RND family efflux transporter MFP subunit
MLQSQPSSSSASLPAKATWPVSPKVAWGLAALLAALAVGWLIYYCVFSAAHSEGGATSAAPPAVAPAETAAEVVLTPEKEAAAQLTTVAVTEQTLQEEQTVPGRIEYNPSRLLELKAPVAGVARRVFVQQGDRVEKGALLAILDGSEIGIARAEIKKGEAELAARMREFEWAEQVANNLEDLLKALARGTDPTEIERQFEGKLLGDHREKLLAAYSRTQLANTLAQKEKLLADTGVSSARMYQEQKAQREIAAAEYKGLAERSRFQAIQAREKARADMEYAKQVLRVSELKLASLAGNFAQSVPAASEGLLTEMELRAPFAGTIEQRQIVEAERIVPNETLFTLANSETLRVSIEIRENQWGALRIQKGQRLKVRTPALPGREFVAEVQYAGGSVSQQTRAVPLVASIDNAEGLLKPGMLVWVSLPTGPPRSEIVIPPGALMRHDREAFVFVEEGPRTYRKVDVTPGIETPQWIAVAKGLQPGQKVVQNGAFVLKSELLLEGVE